MTDATNEPPLEKWPIPSCGVSRGLLIMARRDKPAAEYTITDLADEMIRHFEAGPEAIDDLAAVLADAKPSNYVLNQIYRHAFHPLHLATIGEALACPQKTRKRQLQAAFVPVIGAAGRVAPPKPRRPSVNPKTKDFKKFTRQVGEGIAWHMAWNTDDDDCRRTIDDELTRAKGVQSAHHQAVMQAALAEAHRQVEWARADLERKLKAVEVIEKEAAKIANKGIDEVPRAEAAE